jgi:hypothetical protein
MSALPLRARSNGDEASVPSRIDHAAGAPSRGGASVSPQASTARPRPSTGRGGDGPVVPATLRATSGGPAAWCLGAALGTFGCGPTEHPVLVAQPGCGLEGEAFTDLRVQARGDFPPDDANELLVQEGRATLPVSPEEVAAVTVEGLVGDLVTAVGRSPRLEGGRSIPVYFSPADTWCAVPSTVTFRDPGAMAVDERGDVIVVGGRAADGLLVDDVVHMRDETGVAVAFDGALPVPMTGASLHAVGARTFLAVGGAGLNLAAIAHALWIDVEDEGVVVSDPVPLPSPVGARAYHGAAIGPEGIVLTGGCRGLDLVGGCAMDEGAVLDGTVTLEVDADGRTIATHTGPPLATPRYEHALLLAPDGVAFVAGGRSVGGVNVLQPERRLRDGAAWEPYGPELLFELGPDALIEGATLLDGGMLVLAMHDGTVRWLTETETGRFDGWCGPDEPCFRALVDPTVARARTLLALPGERVLADGFLLPVAGLAQSGSDAVDLAVPASQNPLPPPGPRRGATGLVLSDGSVMLAGGRDPESDQPAQPFFVRMRPPLDGPDEEIPDVARLAPGSLITLQPDRVRVEDDVTCLGPPPSGTVALGDEVVCLLSAGVSEDFPPVQAHARGFRSARFRFELTLRVDSEHATPHLLLTQGAVATTSVRLGETGVRGFRREADGTTSEFSCGLTDIDWSVPQRVQLDVRPAAIRLLRAGEEIAQCPGAGDSPSAIGIGVSGSGALGASDLRLSRR